MNKYELNGGASLKYYAQNQLSGKTHFVDDETLRFFSSRITDARAICDGHLFAIVTSDALNMHNTKRGFRATVFDTDGHVVFHEEMEDAHRTTDQAIKAMWEGIETLNLKTVYADMIERKKRALKYEIEDINKLKKEIK